MISTFDRHRRFDGSFGGAGTAAVFRRRHMDGDYKQQEQQNRTARPVKNRRERQQIDIFKDVHAPFFFRPLSGRNGKVRLLCN